MSHDTTDSLFRVDSGANMFVGNQAKYFSRLIRKKIGVELGTAAQGYFEGVGIMVVSIPDHPESLFLLYPTFLSTTDNCCTISNGALQKYSGFKRVLIDTHNNLEVTLKDGRHFAIPFIVQDSIDFIKLHIHTPTKATKQRLSCKHMSLQPVSITNKILPGTVLYSWWLHINFCHRSLSILQEMIDKGEITGPGLPCKLAPLPGRCPICDAAGMTKIPRGSLRDTSELPIGVMFHIDFNFLNTVSCRGFTATLIIVERTSRYVWIFPTRCKSAPIDLCLYFFNHLIRRGLPCTHIRTDEDGALINNTEFCKLIYRQLGMVIESTGGYESSLNGAAESPTKTIKKMTRASLIGADMPDTDCCFAMQYSACVNNQILNRMSGKVPSKVLTGKSIPIKNLHPFGARCKVLHHLPSKRTLSARTSGDLRQHQETDYDSNAINIIDASQKSSFNGSFMGFSNHWGIILVKKQGATESDPDRIVRVRHSIVDHYGLSASDSDVMSPNEKLLQQFHSQTFNPSSSLLPISSVQVRKSNFDTVASPFDPKECIKIEIVLPPEGTTLGLHLDTDEDYLLPILGRVSYTSPLFSQLPEKYHFYTHWIIQVGDQHPITAAGCRDALYSLQQAQKRKITITLCKMLEEVRYPHQTYRAIFDSCTTKRYGHMITSSVEPKCHSSISKCLDDPDFGDDWRQALFHQYDKNDAVKLVAQPCPIESLPEGVKVHRTVISTKVKKKAETLFQLVARMCADGSKQEQGIDFEFSYSPTAGAAALKMCLAIAASYKWIISIIDIVNCFQSTLLPIEERLVIACPPKYVEWFKTRYPKVKLPDSPSGRYILQLLNGLQGDKSIGRKWYLLLKNLLQKFGFVVCPPEPSIFIYEKGEHGFILNTSTDDFLCIHSTQAIYEELCTYLKEYFDITTCTGPLLKYLNTRIIQSEFGVSYDQTEHIEHKIIKKHFPDDKIGDSIMKEVHTPFRTDSQYEIDLSEQLPATKEELKKLIEKYGAPFASILGDIMHVWVWSRLDIGYATSRLSQYTHAPNTAAFQGLYRILRYLATHPHRPIFYPAGISLDDYQELRVDFDAPNFESMNIPNGLCEVVDADHARDHATRKSHHCVIALLIGVAVHWKMMQQKCVALHSTDSEIRGNFAATKEGLKLQDIGLFIRIPTRNVRPLPIYTDSQPAIDSIASNTITSRIKHIAVPTTFMHEQVQMNKVEFRKVDTKLNIADSGTKPTPVATFFHHFDFAIGVRFYPPESSEHYKLLELHKFKPSPYSNR